MMMNALVLLSLLFVVVVNGTIYDFENDLKAIADDRDSQETLVNNRDILNNFFSSIATDYDELYIGNKTFYLTGGVYSDKHLSNLKIVLDGTLSFTDNNNRETWPTDDDGNVLECIELHNLHNTIFTSNGKGTFDGNGATDGWWGAIKFLKYAENRPRLMHLIDTSDIIVENLLFKNSAYWTFLSQNSNGLVIRYSEVSARYTNLPGHSLIDLQAFNTDGFDVTGNNVHIHDCDIWNQDDCIAVKETATNMLFERVNCSGLGLVIGSIEGTMVKNITFRDCYLKETFKGIYVKTRWSDLSYGGPSSTISDVLYENIVMDSPQQYGKPLYYP